MQNKFGFGNPKTAPPPPELELFMRNFDFGFENLKTPPLKNWNFSWRTMTLDLKTSKHPLLPKRKTSHEHLGIQILQDGLLVRDHLEPQA